MTTGAGATAIIAWGQDGTRHEQVFATGVGVGSFDRTVVGMAGGASFMNLGVRETQRHAVGIASRGGVAVCGAAVVDRDQSRVIATVVGAVDGRDLVASGTRTIDSVEGQVVVGTSGVGRWVMAVGAGVDDCKADGRSLGPGPPGIVSGAHMTEGAFAAMDSHH